MGEKFCGAKDRALERAVAEPDFDAVAAGRVTSLAGASSAPRPPAAPDKMKDQVRLLRLKTLEIPS